MSEPIIDWMNVGILTDAFPPEVGGIQIFADQFVTQLAQAPDVDHIEVLAFCDGDDEERSGVSIRRVGVSRTPIKLVKGFDWFRNHSFDVIHSLTLYPSALVAALCKRLDPSVKAYTTVYGLDAISLANHPILGPIHRFIFGSLDEVLFFSESTREETHDTYSRDFPSRRIYPGAPQFDEVGELDSGQFAERTLDGDEFIVLTVARLVERKGIDDLIAAVSDLPDVHLWIVGDGPQRDHLESQVPDAARDRMTFFGEISHGQLPTLYEQADLFCLPSVYLEAEGDIEGLGLVFLEAQQFGLPVIGTRSGGIPEAFANGETGFLVDERAPAQIRERIRDLYEDEELYNEFSVRAKTFVEEEFSWDKCIREHLIAYGS